MPRPGQRGEPTREPVERLTRGFRVVALLALSASAASAGCQAVLGIDEGKPRPESTVSSGSGGNPCQGCALLLGGGGETIVAGEFREAEGWAVRELTGTTPSAPAVAISAEGLGVGLLRLTGGETTPLRFTTWTPGTWSELAPLGSQGSSRSEPSLSAGVAGVQAVFQPTDYKHVFALFRGGVWSPDAEPVGGVSTHSYGPSAADIASVGGEALVAFMNGADGAEQNHLFVQRRTEGGWDVAQHLTGDVNFEVPPRIVALDSGLDALVVYAQTGSNLLFSTRRQGAAWGEVMSIGNAYTMQRPALAALPGGGAVLAFRGNDGRLYVARYNGSAWSAAVEVPTLGGATLPAPPAVAPGVGGAEVELVYADGGGAAYHMRAMGEGWSEPVLITSRAGLSLLAIASAP